ncbi:hypothetical protein RIF29_04719 [Crotalaria pallida]|uniref:Reverse transcriptase zinc-binding domain-containing protein n=1 Tax=Crotalaria pallida TaxID=3830 RepID=A0AAN9P9E7_CROPI
MVEGGIGLSSRDQSQIWKCLWSLKIPEKVKIFWWRALRGILPTKDNLIRKKLSTPSSCNWCDEGEFYQQRIILFERSMHCFFHCDFAKEVWSNLNLWDSVSSDIFYSSLSWFSSFIGSNSCDSVSFVVIVLWNLWNARNTREFQGRRKSVYEVVSEIAGLWES